MVLQKRQNKKSNYINNNLPIAIACRLDKDNALELTKKILNYLIDEKRVKVVLESRIAQRFYPHLRRDLREMNASNTKILLSIGGDGTILRVAQALPLRNPVPIMGINLGSIGFLDEFESNGDTLYKSLDKIIEGDYIVEKFMRLSTYYSRRRLPDALNEIYICSSKPSKVLHFAIKVDNQLFNAGYADGVIISTALGSTAYCLSAGGVLVDPRLRIIQIIPVNPFAKSGSLKPIIVPARSVIEIKILRPRLMADIIVDGQFEIKGEPKSSVKIRQSEYDIRLAKLIDNNNKNNFYQKLREKILIGIILPIEDSPEE